MIDPLDSYFLLFHYLARLNIWIQCLMQVCPPGISSATNHEKDTSANDATKEQSSDTGQLLSHM